MYPPDLISHHIRLHILLNLRLCPLPLPHRLLPRPLLRFLHPPNPKINPRSNLLNLHPRHPLPTPLRHKPVNAHMHHLPRPFLFLPCHETNQQLQPLHIHLLRLDPPKEIHKQALRKRILILDRALKRRPTKTQQRLNPNRRLRALELLQRPERFRYHEHFHHIQHLPGETPHPCQRVRALLAVGAEDEKAGIVFLREEFEGGGVFEGVDVVFLGEADGVRAF